jgi:segregation and condensation protein B
MSTSDPTEPDLPEDEAAEEEDEFEVDPGSDGTEAVEDAEAEPDLSLEKLQLRARKYPPERVQAIIEGLLFVSDKPLALDTLEKVTGIGAEPARSALERIGERFGQPGSGLLLHEVAGGFQLRSGPESAEFIRRMLQIKPQRLTRPALETLAVIAYRQPVTRPEIEDIRGVDCGAVVKALLERKLIKILGKKEEPGHPLLYGTTREFLEFFNLKNLASLPTLREFQELSEEHKQIVEEQAPTTPLELPVGPILGTVQALSDPEFLARQKASEEASEKALADLETAMDEAEAKARETEEMLKPQATLPGPESDDAAPAPPPKPAAPPPEPAAPPPLPVEPPPKVRKPRKSRSAAPPEPLLESAPVPEPPPVVVGADPREPELDAEIAATVAPEPEPEPPDFLESAPLPAPDPDPDEEPQE